MFEPFGPLYEISRDPARMAGPAPGPPVPRPFLPAADVEVAEDGITLVMDVPGMRPEDLTIELEGDVLTVRGERRSPYGEGELERAVPQRLERAFGRFERTIRVPRGLDPEAVQASMDHGVLTLRIAVPAAREPRRIDVGVGQQPAGQQPGGQAQAAGGTQSPAQQQGEAVSPSP